MVPMYTAAELNALSRKVSDAYVARLSDALYSGVVDSKLHKAYMAAKTEFEFARNQAWDDEEARCQQANDAAFPGPPPVADPIPWS